MNIELVESESITNSNFLLIVTSNWLMGLHQSFLQSTQLFQRPPWTYRLWTHVVFHLSSPGGIQLYFFWLFLVPRKYFLSLSTITAFLAASFAASLSRSNICFDVEIWYPDLKHTLLSSLCKLVPVPFWLQIGVAFSAPHMKLASSYLLQEPPQNSLLHLMNVLIPYTDASGETFFEFSRWIYYTPKNLVVLRSPISLQTLSMISKTALNFLESPVFLKWN